MEHLLHPPTAITDPQNRVIYIPAGAELTNQVTSFTIVASDNTGSLSSNSSTITVPINIIHVPRPPVVSNTAVAIDSGVTVVNVTANVTDADSPLSSLFIIIRALPDPSIGFLVVNNTNVTVGDQVPYPFLLTFNVIGTGPAYTSFSFSASDGTQESSTYGIVGIGLRSPINIAPVAIAPSDTLIAQRGVPLAIQLGANDDDILETFTYNVGAVSTGGSFSYGGVTLNPPTFTVTLDQDQHTYVTNAIISFTAPVNALGNDFLIINFTVSDGTDTSGSVGISVSIAPNSAPTATPPAIVSFLEGGNSTAFFLTGTDSDPADANTLHVNITSLPSKGTLYIVGGGPVTSIGGLYPQSTQFYIVGAPLQFGDDSFTYQLVDLVGGTSAIQTVPISITHVNHSPTAGIHLPEGIMNDPLSMQIYGQDVDPYTFITAYITELPAVGYLTQSDGTIITSASQANPTLVTSTLGRVVYIPPTYTFGNISSFSFFVADNSGAANNRSQTFIANITIAKGDLPPVAYDSNVNANDGGSVSVLLNATDPQGYPLIATITQFPSSGYLQRSDGSIITADNPTVGSDSIFFFFFSY